MTAQTVPGSGADEAPGAGTRGSGGIARIGTAETAYVEVTALERTYGAGATSVHALRGVSMSVARGEFLAVRGRSGSGKTTLLNIIGGLDRADSGVVRIAGHEVTSMTDEALLGLRRGTVAYVFQNFGLVPILTARENVGLPLRLRGIDPSEREARVSEALEHVGLAAHVNQRPAEMSGGQQQRVGLARAIASRPGLLLADEPTGQVDSHTARDIMELIGRLVQEESMTAIVTTHDPVLLSLADRVLDLHDGEIIA